ncbi:MAG: DUF5627 domain-containing protein [Bacteroidia bacterium]|nr:DUF5627 domain-containing protein [Bacteroidia bacterium]
MNKFKNIVLATAVSAFTVLTGCENADKDFPDYGEISVYFPYQTPVRTLVLGSVANNNDAVSALDREHKCKIMATMGGAYKGKDITVDFVVDNSLVDGVNEVKAMPSEYYQVLGTQMKFNGNPNGGVEVQLTDAFFADPNTVNTTYVIPMVMTSAVGADKILAGDPSVENPNRLVEKDWFVTPKDYVLYAIKYVNKYHGSWLRLRECSGDITENSYSETITNKTPIVSLSTVSLSASKYEVDVKGLKCVLDLVFDGSENCAISTTSEGWTVKNASGKFTSKGAKKAWGELDRDLIELSYTIEHENGAKLTTKEKLVWQKNGVVMPETFSYTINK